MGNVLACLGVALMAYVLVRIFQADRHMAG